MEEKTMHKAHKVKNVIVEGEHLKIEIDGKVHIFDLRKISKRLLTASPSERQRFEISPSGCGIHWPLIDEDLSINGLLTVKHSKVRKLAYV